MGGGSGHKLAFTAVARIARFSQIKTKIRRAALSGNMLGDLEQIFSEANEGPIQ